MKHIKETMGAVIAIALAAGFSGKANADTVYVTDVSTWSQAVVVNVDTSVNMGASYKNYNGGVYAGINTFDISTTPTGPATLQNGFCIDPYDFSFPENTQNAYTTEPLASAPKVPGGGMGATTALAIEQLWANQYSPTMSAIAAAGLQLAIWELVAADQIDFGHFSIDSNQSTDGHSAVNQANADLKFVNFNSNTEVLNPNPSEPVDANLVGITNPNGQDYVISGVPDGGFTFAMLGLTLAGLAVFARTRALGAGQWAAVKLQPRGY